MADDRSGPLPARRTLATRLWSLRQAAGLGQIQLAEATGISQGKISKIENGAQPIRVDHVDAWARVCGVDEKERDHLVDLAEAGQSETSTWRSELSAGLAAKQHRVAALEARAKRIREFQPAVVPGLLQTLDYARAVFTAVDVTGQSDLAEAAQARIDRQSVLDDPDTTVELIVTEAALAWRLDEAQRDALAAAARRPSVRLGILPIRPVRAAPPTLNPFIIYEFGDGSDSLIVIETYGGETYHSDPRDVAVYGDVFDALAAGALYGPQAEALLAGLPLTR